MCKAHNLARRTWAAFAASLRVRANKKPVIAMRKPDSPSKRVR